MRDFLSSKTRKRASVLFMGFCMLVARSHSFAEGIVLPQKPANRESYQHELIQLEKAMAGVDLSRAIRNKWDGETLAVGTEDGDVLIVAAASETNLDLGLFKSKYPEIFRRSGVYDIGDFGDGKPKILCKRRISAGFILVLRLLDPSMLKSDRDKLLEDEISVEGFVEQSPILIKRGKRETYIEAFNQIRPMTRESGKRTYFALSAKIVYAKGRLVVEKVTKKEFPEESYVEPEIFFDWGETL